MRHEERYLAARSRSAGVDGETDDGSDSTMPRLRSVPGSDGETDEVKRSAMAARLRSVPADATTRRTTETGARQLSPIEKRPWSRRSDGYDGSGSAMAARSRSVPKENGETDEGSGSALAARSRSVPRVDGETDEGSGSALAARSRSAPGVDRETDEEARAL